MNGRNLLIVLFAISLFACHSKQANKNLIPINSMKLILWDILKADAWYAQTTIRDTMHLRLNENFQLYEQVFKIHHISKAQFYFNYRFYESHPEQYRILIDSVLAVGSRDKVVEKPTPVPANFE